MGGLGLVIGVAVGIFGLIGAIYWYLASRASRRNRIAAIFTGVAASLAIVGSFISFLSGQSPSAALNATKIDIFGGGIGINNGTIIYPPPATTASPTARKYEGVPGIPLDDEEVRGILKPANDPTPHNACDAGPNSNADNLKVLIGTNAIEHNGMGMFVPIGIRDCVPLSIERRPDGIFVNASLYDRANGSVVTIRDNRISALNGANYTARQSKDEARLTIRNVKGNELFYLRFLNFTTIEFRGFLGCSANETILVRENQPIPGFFMSGGCLSGQRGIQIGSQTP